MQPYSVGRGSSLNDTITSSPVPAAVNSSPRPRTIVDLAASGSESDSGLPSSGRIKWQPHRYQFDAIQLLLQKGAVALFLDPGLGKTSIVLMAFKLLKAKGMAKKMLVVAPLRAAQVVWPSEVAKWDAFDGLKVTVLHGPKKDELVHDDADIHVINPEGLAWLFGVGRQGPVLRRTGSDPWPYDILVVDESTRFKHTNTQRFKVLKPYLSLFRRRYILTGSPAPNGLLDLFGQVFILDMGAALGRYITHFRREFFDQSGFGGYTWTPKADTEKRIIEKLRPFSLRLEAKDYLKLPPLINNKVITRLPEGARAAYRQMEELLLAQIEGDMITAANAAAATNKCRQIANGGIFDGTGEEWFNIHEAKVDAVEEIVEELGGKPALVAFEYRHDLDRLSRRFGARVPYIAGGVPASRFRQIEAGWNRGDIPLLLAQPQSVAHGLNLQGTGAAIIWHSLPWDLEIYEQFIRRVWRQGQQSAVVVHHIVMENTVDEAVMSAIMRKDRDQRSLLGALKAHLERRNDR